MFRGIITACALLILIQGCASDRAFDRGQYLLTGAEPPQVSCRPDAPPRQWAVVVGVNQYADERIADLSGAVNDAWTFYHYLASPQGAGVHPDRLQLLLNDQATRENAVGALGNFLARACPQDQIVIFFAGHGVPEPGRPEEAFLLLHDTQLDNLVATGISMNRLPDFLDWRAGGAGRLLLFVDACHSGTIQFPGNRGGVIEGGDRFEMVNKAVAQTIEGQKGWGALSASASDELAQERKDAWSGCKIGDQTYSGGLFTCHLISGMVGAADRNKDSDVTLDELYTHLELSVSRDSGYLQVPQLSGDLDPTVVVSKARGQSIAIPQVPERFLVVESPNPLRPYVLGAGGLAGAVLIAGAIFHISAELEASDIERINDTDPGSRSRARDAQQRKDHDDLVAIAQSAYIAGGVLAGATLVGLIMDLAETPQGIEDVYILPPGLRLQVVPLPGGAAANIAIELD